MKDEYCSILMFDGWHTQTEFEKKDRLQTVLDIRNWPYKKRPTENTLGSTRPHHFCRFIERL
jgi:hypothetical protein